LIELDFISHVENVFATLSSLQTMTNVRYITGSELENKYLSCRDL